ncbi:MAG: DnaA N-terminal domain-containing protein, partial [Melioribacteraceae bacterium]
MQNAAEVSSNFQLERNAKDLWKECLSLIKENVPFITYNTWFLPIRPFELENATLKIYVPNNFFIEWIEEHYNTLINKTVSQVLGETGKLVYVIYEEKEVSEEPAVQSATSSSVPAAPQVKPLDYETYLNPRYTFENFIKGEGNQL